MSTLRLMCRHTALKVGKTYLDNLLDQGDFEEAADLCVRVFKNEKRLWQDEAIVRYLHYSKQKCKSKT